MKHASALAMMALWLVAASGAIASEESTRLYSRGLVEFHAGRHAQALEFFDQAVAADAEDSAARYYRAVTRSMLGNNAGAIDDLRAVLSKKPYLDVAALDLGVILVQTGAYRDAVPWLTQAQRDTELNARASLFLGLAQLRLGRLEEARGDFQRAAAKDPAQRLAARYYEGVVDYREARWSDARQHFSYVVSASPDSDVGREAALFLAKISEGQRPSLEVFGAAGLQYDSNVVLAPSDDIIDLDISKRADGRATISAGGTAVPWGGDRLQLLAGYEFYQSLHFELNEFDIQDHGTSLQLVGQAGPARFGLLGRYDYYLLQADSFLQEVNVLPWLTILDERGRTELFCRVRRRDFKQQAFYVRDAFNYAPGVRQFLYLGAPERYFSAGYQFDREAPVINERRAPRSAAERFAYSGNQAEAGIGWALPAAVTADATYAYRHELYDDDSALFNQTGERRRDNVHQMVVVARKQLTAHLDVTAAYLGTFNDSNDVNFEYDRHIGSLALGVRF